MLDDAVCSDCENFVEEFIPTDRGLKRGEWVCRLDRAIEDCEIVKQHNWEMMIDRNEGER